MAEEKEVHQQSPSGKTKQSSWKKRLLYLLLFLLLLPMFLSLVLHIPLVQNWAVSALSSELSERLETPVKINSVNFGVFDGLIMKDFTVMSSEQDTIIGAQKLNVSLQKNLFSLWRNNLSINAVTLQNPQVHLIRDGDKINNLITLLKKLSSPKDQNAASRSSSSMLNLEINTLDISNLSFIYEDRYIGKKVEVHSQELFLELDSLSLDSLVFHVDEVTLKNPRILLTKINKDSSSILLTTTTKDTITEAKKQLPPTILVRDLRVLDGFFTRMSAATNKQYFTPSNFQLKDIQLEIKNFKLDRDANILASVKDLSLTDDKGFKIEELSCDSMQYTNKAISLPDFVLVTPSSYISTSLKLSYRNRSELSQVLQRTIAKAEFQDTKIAIKDLLHFIPKLNDSKFFKNNSSKTISLSGKFSGRPANIKGNDVVLAIPGILEGKGNFGTRNLDSKYPLINLRMKSLSTSIPKLQRLIPEFQPPANFYKLGDIIFKGNFDGYLNDFVAYGTIKSTLGTVKTDMRLDLKDGVQQASYSGDISLINFDLKQWSGNNKLGNITFEGKVRNGMGLTINNATADLEGSLKNLTVNGYEYRNININGVIDQNKFDGKLSSSDLNFNFGFDGYAELVGKNIEFDFNADIGIIDFQAINISKKPLRLKGAFDLKGSGNSIDNLLGTLVARDLYIQQDTLIQVDSLIIHSKEIATGKELSIITEDSYVDMAGKFSFKTIARDFQSIIKKNYPYHTRLWKYSPREITSDQDVNFDIKLKNNKPLFELLGLPLQLKADTIFAKGYLNSAKEEINVISSLPSFKLDQYSFTDLFFNLNSLRDRGNFQLQVDRSQVNRQQLNKFSIETAIVDDELSFSLNSDGIVDSLQEFSLRGKLVPFDDEGYSLEIIDNSLRLYGQRWKINADNQIKFKPGYIDVDNFSITDGVRLIDISDINNKGLRLNVNRFDIDLLNTFMKDDRIIFSGYAYSNIRVNDIFAKSPDVYGNILMTDIKLNGDSYGELNIDLSKPIDRPLDAIVSFNNDSNGQAIKMNASIDIDKKYVDADIKAKNVPLKIIEYLLYKGIRNVEGSADISGKVFGPFDGIEITSQGKTNEASTEVIVLGETYTFSDQEFSITHNEIDFEGAKIRDSKGGVGNITGGLTHTLFKDFYLNCGVTGDNVIALNTTKFDNPTYYGVGKGDVTVDFTGSVNYPNIYITALTRRGTEINIPIQSTQTTSSESFIKFIDSETYFSDTIVNEKKGVRIDGVSLEMNLVLTPDAKVNLIFDESTGDIIEGQGNGNMQINMNRNGDFDIFGEYIIREGKYLFTALGFINKPFDVREGGKVRWDGDPVNARIDLVADYQVRTDLSTFLAEYLVTPALQQAASNRTDVSLQMYIGNTLFNPTISFGLEFPDLTGDLKSYADSKVRLLNNNPNDLNSQVFGLIVFNSFLPSNTLSQVLASGNVIQSASVNTLSEFVSNQLSSYVTRFLNETLEENGLIAGIDFDINLRNNLSLGGVQTNDFTVVPTEIEVKLKNRFRFLDERLSFDVGGNFVRESLIRANNYVVPEFTFRYALTPDRKLNLKVYGKYDLDEISVNSRRQRLGVGLRYRTEFGSMLETKSIINNSLIQVN